MRTRLRPLWPVPLYKASARTSATISKYAQTKEKGYS